MLSMMPACCQRGRGGSSTRDHHDVNRQPRGAAHERRDEDGDEAVLAVLDGARGHDAGDGAGKRAEHRDEGFAVQADLRHQPIHDEGGARHVAGVLENPEEEEEDENLRQEDDDAADAGDDAVGEQAVQVAVRHLAFTQSASARVAGVDPIHRILRDGEDAEKHQRHHRRGRRPSPRRDA